MRYTLAGFRRFAVCLAVCRGRLTVTSALRPSAGVGDLCRVRSPKRPFCSLVCQILLGPIMGLLEIPMRRKCCSPNGSSGRTERSILLHIPFSRSSGQCAYRPQLPSRIKVHESQAVLCEACSQSLSLILICLSDSFFRSLVFTVFPFSRSFIERTFMKHLQFDRFQVLCYVLDHGHENLLVSASGKS